MMNLGVLPTIREHLSPTAHVVSLIKGFAFDEDSGEIGPLSVSLSRELGGAEVSALMGPTIYTVGTHAMNHGLISERVFLRD